MVVDISKCLLERYQALEVVAHLVLLGHTYPAVQLDPLLAHDTAAAEWPGPVLAVSELLAARPELQAVTLPFFPGLSVIQRESWPLEIRIAKRATFATKRRSRIFKR